VLKWLFEKVVGWPWCFHKWEIIRRVDVSETSGESFIGYTYHLQCQKCGDVKKRYLGN
jgi:hypothetical protein